MGRPAPVAAPLRIQVADMLVRRPAGPLAALVLALSAAPAAAQTYTWNGPYTGTGATANPWSVDASWVGGQDPSTAGAGGSGTVRLVFDNFDANTYSASNDLGNPFSVNGVTLSSTSTSSFTVSNFSTTTNKIRLTGDNPFVDLTGPGSASFATGAAGLDLAPTSGTTTIRGAGNGVLTIGNSTITGTGGLTIAQTGLGGVNLFGANTFTGGVVLDSANPLVGGPNGYYLTNSQSGLTINAGATLGAAANTLTIKSGVLRGAATVANAVDLQGDLVFGGGTMTLSGAITQTGGPRGLVLINGTNGSTSSLTLGNAATYTGATTILNSVPRATTTGTLTLNATGSLANTQAITIGNNGTLAITGNGANTRVNDAAPVTLNGGRIALAGAAGGALSETLGPVTASGQSVMTVTAGATNTTLALGTFTRDGAATLLLRGPWNAGTNQLTVSGGVPLASDPLAPSTTGQYLGVVPWAAGNATSTALSAAALVTYDPAGGFRYVTPTNAAEVLQLADDASFGAAAQYRNVNLLGDAVVTGAQRVNSLSSTRTSPNNVLTGAGTLTVSSGAVLAAGGVNGVLVFSGPTLDFGAATGYFHLGSSVAISNGSTITGSGGVVITGLDTTAVVAPRFQFSSTSPVNSFTGGLTINGNAVATFTADTQLGAAGGGVTLGGGGLTYNLQSGTATSSRPITLGPAGGNLTTANSDQGGDLVWAGTISGPGALSIGNPQVSNNGVVTLSGVNTYAGPTYVNSTTTLRVASDANLGSVAQPLTLFGASTLQLSASNTLQKPVVVVTSATVDTLGNSPTLAGPLASGVNTTLTKAGAGTLTLGNPNPLYSGQVVVTGGELRLAGDGGVGQLTTAVVNLGTTLRLDNAGTNRPDRLPDQARVTLNGGELVFAGNASATSSETLGTLNPGAAAEASRVTVVPGAGQGATLTFQRYVPTGGGTVLFRGTDLGLGGADAAQVRFAGRAAGFMPSALYDATATGVGTAPAFYGSDFGVRAVRADDYFALGGTVIQNSAPVGTPTTATVRVGGPGFTTGGAGESNTVDSLTLAPGGGLTVSNTLSLTSGVLYQEAGGSGTVTGGTLAFGGSLVNVYAGGDLTVASAVTGTSGLVKTGPGTATLAGPVSLTGTVTPLGVNAGTLDIGANNLTVTALSGTAAGTLNLNGTALTVNTPNTSPNAAFPGTITGTATGRLVYNPQGSTTGTLVLGGTNTFGGGVSGNANARYRLTNPRGFGTGVVDLSNQPSTAFNAPGVGFAFGTGGSGTVPAGFRLSAATGVAQWFAPSAAVNQTVTLAGQFTGGVAGAALAFGDGGGLSPTFRLTNPANDFASDVVVDIGVTLSVPQPEVLGNAPLVALLGAGRLRIEAPMTLPKQLVLGLGGGQVDTAGSAVTQSGVVADGGPLTKVGAGTLTLSNAGNTHTGVVRVNGGTLSVTGAIATGTSAVTVNAGGTLAGAGDGTTTGVVRRPVAVASGGTLSAGTGGAEKLTVTGATSFAAGSTLGVRVTAAGASSSAPGGSTAGTVPDPTNTNFLNATAALTIDPGTNVVIDGTGAGFTLFQPYSYAVAQGGTVTLATPITDPSRFTTVGFLADPAGFSLSSSGSVVYVSFTPVPEPAAAVAVAAAGLAVLGRLTRRRATPATVND